MTYVITQKCHTGEGTPPHLRTEDTKDTYIPGADGACVDVCPVDCIHPTDEGYDYQSRDKDAALPEGFQLVIDPDQCIDCGACEPACPVSAIFSEDDVPDEYEEDIEKNASFF